MIALLILLSAVAISIILVRVATRALTLTGLSEEMADFQARSVLAGTGYTTDEAEQMVTHPVRRRIVMLLMLLQNAGLVTVISTFILSFIDTGTTGVALQRGAMLVGGLGGLALLAHSEQVDRALKPAIEWALERFTNLEVRDYYALLNLERNHVVTRLTVEENSWLADRTLEDLDLPGEGVMVLCITRPDGSVACTPGPQYTVNEGDQLTLYGEESGFEELQRRRADASGKASRQEAEERYENRMREQDAREGLHVAGRGQEANEEEKSGSGSTRSHQGEQ